MYWRTHMHWIILSIVTLTFSVYVLHLYHVNSTTFWKPLTNISFVPRIFHFISVEPFLKYNEEISEDVTSIINEWKLKNTDFEVILWTASNIKNKFPILANLLQKIPVSSWISNIVRYKVSYEYGGLYLDTDVMAIRSVQPLLKQFHSGFVVCERPRTNNLLIVGPCKLIGTAVIASTQHNTLMKRVFEKSVYLTEQYLPTIDTTNFSYNKGKRVSGPILLTREFKKSEVPVMGSITFFPCDWSNRSKCVYKRFVNGSKIIYGMHLWKKRWGDRNV
ncbi:Hypothetical predicted protein [Mytilus galloprovincialis]|uniref:Uncharacterized protein n=1 Tax=Mytilus galloprovincialis TaxID=29158 RepID=A0A8B6FE81_MYTGA|nr:Hypothetical predicted protein [Mytilus galloprovincialis]